MRETNKFTLNDWISLVYLTIAVGIVPLIVRVALVGVPAAEQEAFGFPPQMVDVFVYNKSAVLIVSTIAALAVYLLFYTGKNGVFTDLRALAAFPKGRVLAGLHVKLALLLCVLYALSAVFSDYREIVLRGATSRFEGLPVLIAYVVVFFAAVSFCRAHSRLMLAVAAVSAAVIGVLSLGQMAGRDFFLTPGGARLAFGQFYEPGGTFTAEFTMAYASLYNPNYLGAFAAMMIPVFVFGAAAFGRRSVWCYALAALAAVMLASLIGSGSSGALFAFSAGAVVAFGLTAAYFLRKGFTKRAVIGLAAVLAAAAAVSAIPTVNYNIIRMVQRFGQGTAIQYNFFRDIAIGDGFVSVETRYGDLRLNSRGGADTYLSFNGEIQHGSDTQTNGVREQTFSVPYIGHVSTFSGGGVIVLVVRQSTIPLFVTPEGRFYVMGASGEFIDINVPVPAIGFAGHETFGSSRGYIWSRTIPVMLAAPLLGYGPDAFAFAFPQHDIPGKALFFDNPSIIVDKPHNIFFQYAVNTGMLSALILAGLIALFGLRAVHRIFTDTAQDNALLFMRIGLVSAVFIFMVSGMSTDSNVNTSPVFWGLLGMGYGLIHE
ncbi:MAG: O-antigen ligase family protein [Defluviitaleaceae bacterium]|nr:O-antigen ligase family protein [Defluviitaleaceae bacterium]